jgi:hypothetical protein
MKTFEDLVFHPDTDGQPGHLHALMRFENGRWISVTRTGKYACCDALHPYEVQDDEGEFYEYQTSSGVTAIMAIIVRSAPLAHSGDNLLRRLAFPCHFLVSKMDAGNSRIRSQPLVSVRVGKPPVPGGHRESHHLINGPRMLPNRRAVARSSPAKSHTGYEFFTRPALGLTGAPARGDALPMGLVPGVTVH